MLLLLLMIMGFQGDTISTSMQNLDEVVVSARGQGGHRSEKGQVASIDEHLSQLRNVSLVRRGSYAWEPVVNQYADGAPFHHYRWHEDILCLHRQDGPRYILCRERQSAEYQYEQWAGWQSPGHW